MKKEMELKNDTRLKKMMEDMTYYCKDKDYNLVLAVNTQDEYEGQAISASGDVFSIVVNLVMFAEKVGRDSGYNVLELVKKYCESELKKNANHSGGKEKTMPEMFKEHISEIEEMKDKFDDYLDILDELDGKYTQLTDAEEEIYAGYRAVWEHLMELSCEINLYLKKANANHS